MIVDYLPPKSILALLVSCSEFLALGNRLPWVPKTTESILDAFDQYRDGLEYRWITARMDWGLWIKNLAKLVEVSGIIRDDTAVQHYRLTRSIPLDLSNESGSWYVYTISYNNRAYICGLEVMGSNIVGYKSSNKYIVRHMGKVNSFRFSSDSFGIQSICLSSPEYSSEWIPESPERHAGYEGRRCLCPTANLRVLVITLDVRDHVSMVTS